ncbi:MAG: phospholipase D-like domain-containing protein [Deltaproteobacteria bacterium]
MLARNLVQLAALIERDRSDIDLFSKTADELLSSYLPAVDLIERAGRSARNPTLVVKVVLQALNIQRRLLERALFRGSFVATMPGEIPLGVSPTAQVIAEMLRPDCREVVALGYEISDAQFLARLRELATAGTRITLVTHAEQSDLEMLASDWPDHSKPAIYVGSTAAMPAPFAKMHSKALVIDDDDLLVTSANLTFHGLQGNIEFGVRIRGHAAAEGKKVFEEMLKSGALVPWESDL